MTENEKCADYMNVPKSSWTRPEGPKRVWRVVQGRKKMADGEIPRFIIQEIPEELEEFIMDTMLPQYLAAEAICSSLDMHNDSQALLEFRTLWKNIFSQGISIAALKVNTDSTAEPVIAGFNMLNVLTAEDINYRVARREDSSLGVRNSGVKKLVSVLGHLRHNADILGTFGVDKYMAAVGLFVHPTFRGQGLGEELLRVRGDVGSAYRIPATATVFSAPSSIISATRAGFEILVEKKFKDIIDAEGKVAFPRIKTQEMKLMGKKFY